MPKKKPETTKKLHVKPTQEELEEGIKKTQEELETLEPESTDDSVPIKPSEETEEDEVEPKEEPEEEPEGKPEEPESGEEPPTEPETPFKTKFIKSQQESIVLHGKNKKTNETIAEAMATPDPTEEELQAEFPDWETMNDFEKKMATESLTNKRRMEILAKIAEDNKDVEAWVKKVNDFTDDPKTLIDNPELEGRVEEFSLFATKPTRRNVEFEILVSAFLHDASKEVEPKKKKKMFPEGSGGPPGKPGMAGKISVEDSIILKKTDFKKYKELLKAGKIDTSEL